MREGVQRSVEQYRRHGFVTSVGEWKQEVNSVGVPLILQLAIVLTGMGIAAYAVFVRFPERITAANDEIRRRKYVPPPRRADAQRSKPTPAGRRRRHR